MIARHRDGSPVAALGLAGALIALSVGRDLLARAHPATGTGVVLAAYLALLAFSLPWLRSRGTMPPRRAVAVGVGLGVLISVVLLLGWFRDGCQLEQRSVVPASLLVVLFGAVVEELAVRGALWRNLATTGVGPTARIGITAVVFAAMHLGSRPLLALVPVLLFGLLLGIMRLAPGGLTAPIAAHLGINGLAQALACTSL